MATTAVDRVFVDTNVLVFATQVTAPWHTTAELALSDLRAAGTELWISRQILREYLAALSRPQTFASPLPVSVLVTDVAQFQQLFFIAEDGPAATAYLLTLLGIIPCAGRQIHDANIVATMLAHGIPNLLTHNVADFQRFAAYVTVVPLVP
jgi:predicted nucleic acid-binding protein